MPESTPDAPTREHALAIDDEEDTLHPEDGVAPPPPGAVDTMIVPAAEIDAAAEHPAPEPPQAGLGRRLLALLVIIALIAVIVVLVWWGLAR
jgi:hypothetical protein